jgi:hypothetical protein
LNNNTLLLMLARPPQLGQALLTPPRAIGHNGIAHDHSREL